MFFFFKQKTAYEMRISDWSSDVCSSDLWPGLVEAMERPDLGDDPRFATKPLRIENARVLVAEFDRTFATRDYAWWRSRLDENGVTFGSVTKPTGIATDAPMLAPDVLVPLYDPAPAAQLTIGSLASMDCAAQHPTRP